MPANMKLEGLQHRLIDHQRVRIMQAAEAGVLPASGALEQIASLEGSIVALDSMLDLAETDQPAIVERRDQPVPPAATPRAELAGTLTGTVKWFNTTKGYGFITPDIDGPDAFVHVSAVERSGMRELYEGQKLAYGLRPDPRTGKSSAVDLKVVD